MKYLEPPITDASRLAENGTVWTKEAKHAPIWQAPMPNLTKIFEIYKNISWCRVMAV